MDPTFFIAVPTLLTVCVVCGWVGRMWGRSLFRAILLGINVAFLCVIVLPQVVMAIILLPGQSLGDAVDGLYFVLMVGGWFTILTGIVGLPLGAVASAIGWCFRSRTTRENT